MPKALPAADLHGLIKSKHDSDLKKYIEKNFASLNFEAIDSDGNNVLHKALLCEKFAVAELLISTGCVSPLSVNAVSGDSCLHILAAGFPDQEEVDDIVKLFIDEGLSVNLQNAKKETPSHIAVRNDNGPILDYLIDCGADIFIKNDAGQDLWQLIQDLTGANSASQDYSSSYQILSGIMEVFDQVKSGIIKGDLEQIHDFISDMDVNSVITEDGNSLLHVIATSGNYLQALFALENGANLYAINSNHQTPLDLSSEILQKTFEEEKELHKAMIEAIKGNNLERVSELLEEGITVNSIIDSQENTALHIAVKELKSNIVAKLIQLRSDAEKDNADFKSPLAILEQIQADAEFLSDAEKLELEKIDKIFSADNQVPVGNYQEELALVLNGNLQVINRCIDEKLFKEVVDDKGNTMLHLAAFHNAKVKRSRSDLRPIESVVKLVISEADILEDVLQVNAKGKTVADYAREGGNESLAEMLDTFIIKKKSKLRGAAVYAEKAKKPKIPKAVHRPKSLAAEAQLDDSPSPLVSEAETEPLVDNENQNEL